MAPTSTWKCVALFVNNITCPTRVVGSLIGGGAAKDGSLVPSAVNSLAWSSVEGRLFTGDTDGVVKVWDIKEAIFAGGAQSGGSLSATNVTSSVSATSDNTRSHGIRDNTATSDSRPPSRLRGEGGVDAKDRTKEKNSVADRGRQKGNGASRVDDKETEEQDSEEERQSAGKGRHKESNASRVGGEGSKIDCEEAETKEKNAKETERVGRKTRCEKRDGRGPVVSDCSSVTPLLLSEEFGGTKERGAFADRRVGEWRPGREGRQEVIKVKVFEGQNVEFRAPVAGCGDRDNGSAPVTLTGDVIVATITPDKLEYVASPNHEIAARPLASWRMCVTGNDGVGDKNDQSVDGASFRNDDGEDADGTTPSGRTVGVSL
eukprot:jgi/Undpi1/4003/HiC_scaffold_16.g07371.m1